MAFNNQFPYSDFHELNLDWLIKRTKELESQMAYLQEEFSKITILTEDYIQTMIDAAIAANNVQLALQLAQLKADITAEYKGSVTAQINLLTIYVDNQDVYYDNQAKGYADHALVEAKNYVDQEVMDYTMMINPITGEYDDVRDVVDDIVSYFHTQDALTAAEYDALLLDASYYDGKQLDAYDYDFNGKTLLP